MEINNSEKFWIGLLIIVFAYIPFSHLGQSKKYKTENCRIVRGTIERINNVKGGITVELLEIFNKIRIIGEVYEALEKDKFFEIANPNTKIEIYLLKDEYLSKTDKFNKAIGFEDAVVIKIKDEYLLTLDSVRKRLKSVYWFNLVIGTISCLVGLGFTLSSISLNIKD